MNKNLNFDSNQYEKKPHQIYFEMLSSMTLLDTETVLFENEQFFPELLCAVNPPTISDYFGKFILRIGQAKNFFKEL